MTMNQYFTFPWQLTLRSLIERGVEQQEGGWKKHQKPIVGEVRIVGGWKKLKIFEQQRGWLLNCFCLSFSNLENCSMKNICVCSKSKIKKVTNKQNLEHFKMINQRLFIHNFCNNLKMLLSFSWAMFIRALVFSFSARANFSSFEYLCFSFLLIFRFILIQHTRVKTEKQLYYHKD